MVKTGLAIALMLIFALGPGVQAQAKNRTTLQFKRAVGKASRWKRTTRMRAVLNIKRGDTKAAMGTALSHASRIQRSLQSFLGNRGSVALGRGKVVRFNSNLMRADVELQISVKGKDRRFLESLYRRAQHMVGYSVSQPTYYK